MIVRRGEKGLSTAVLRGLDEARGEFVVVMDADLSHPADRIPEIIARLQHGRNDFVIGSRYVEGGSAGPVVGLLPPPQLAGRHLAGAAAGAHPRPDVRLLRVPPRCPAAAQPVVTDRLQDRAGAAGEG
ncbi:MAG: glycosyltransferase [Chromatiales bacterium]|nr:glycosyltransferase [Chromatiales bacterium]